MSKAQQRQQVREAIGQRLRELRSAHPNITRQEDVATQMRLLHGIEWTRATVAAVETGRREVSIEELLALTIVFEMPLADWFSGDGQVAIGMSWASRRTLRQWLGGDEQIPDDEAHTELYVFGHERAREHPETALAEIAMATLRHLLPSARPFEDEGEAIAAIRESDTEAVTRAAARLNVRPLTVSLLAHGIWGHGLVTERDSRVNERAAGEADANSLRALRGHVSRDLTDELEAVIVDNDVQLREKELQHIGGST